MIIIPQQLLPSVGPLKTSVVGGCQMIIGINCVGGFARILSLRRKALARVPHVSLSAFHITTSCRRHFDQLSAKWASVVDCAIRYFLDIHHFFPFVQLMRSVQLTVIDSFPFPFKYYAVVFFPFGIHFAKFVNNFHEFKQKCVFPKRSPHAFTQFLPEHKLQCFMVCVFIQLLSHEFVCFCS